jgi:hypothetical protein
MNFKNNELLMLGGAFILGVFVDRYMNHRDIVTGEVKEGVDTKDGTDPKKGTEPKKVTENKDVIMVYGDSGGFNWIMFGLVILACVGIVFLGWFLDKYTPIVEWLFPKSTGSPRRTGSEQVAMLDEGGFKAGREW